MAWVANHLRTIQQEDGAAVLDLQRGVISTFNETGAYIWQALRRGETVETIIAALAGASGESRDVVAAGVTEFLKELKNDRLLVE